MSAGIFRTWWVVLLGAAVGCGDGAVAPTAAPEGVDGGSVVEARRCEDSAACDDGVFCNGVERCEPEHPFASPFGCVAAEGSPDCDDGVACTVDECSVELDQCVHRPGDADGDGHSDSACDAGEDALRGDDCDDADPNRFPGNPEVCDLEGHDEDCDLDTFGSADVDQDGYIDSACCNQDSDDEDELPQCGDDCDDRNRNARPDPESDGESHCDGRDDDCDGSIDEHAPGVLWFVDADGDGVGDERKGAVYVCQPEAGGPDYVLQFGDCNDDEPSVYPGALEVCDRLVNNCGSPGGGGVAEVEDMDGDGASADADCVALGEVTAAELPGWLAALPESLLPRTDCDDGRAAVFPGEGGRCDCDNPPVDAQCGSPVCEEGEKWSEALAACRACGQEATAPFADGSTLRGPVLYVTEEPKESCLAGGDCGLVDLINGEPISTTSVSHTRDVTMGLVTNFPGGGSLSEANVTVPWMTISDAENPAATRSAVTAEFWLRPVTGGSNISRQRALRYRVPRSAQEAGFQFVVGTGPTQGAPEFTVTSEVGQGVTAASPRQLRDGRWHHLAGSWNADAQRIRLYVDGVLEEEVPDARGLVLPVDNVLHIGWNNNHSTHNDYRGLLTDVVLYDRELDPLEVRARFELGTCGVHAACTMERSQQCQSPSSCLEMTRLGAAVKSGIYSIDPDGNQWETGAPEAMYCEMTAAAGGWTHAYTFSDDGRASWTFGDRALQHNEMRLGSIEARHLDMKSVAAFTIPFTDLMFVHMPSGVTAVYEGVGDDTGTYADFLLAMAAQREQQPATLCQWGQDEGYVLASEHSTLAGDNMCGGEPDLYFHKAGANSAGTACRGGPTPAESYGPVWHTNHESCPSLTPTKSGVGPNSNDDRFESSGVGFAGSLGLNTGVPGTGQNHLMLYIR